MPNIPNLPGVPSLLSFSPTRFVLMLVDAVSFLGGFSGPQWGIYLNGDLALEVESVVNFTIKRDYAIADYPIEDGGFQSYDKVQIPGDIRVRVSSGGSAAERQAMLDDVESIAGTLDLYDIVTPEKVYRSYNVSHYDVSRTATNGVGLIVCDIWFTEIRTTQSATFSTTQNPVNAGPQAVGNIQAQPANSGAQSRIFGGDLPSVF